MLSHLLNHPLAQKILVLIGGPVMGALLVYVAYAIIADIPEEQALLRLTPANVIDVHYEKADAGTIDRIRLFPASGGCLSIPSHSQGFSGLIQALRTGNDYSIGYHRERELFSDSPQRYNVIYEITAGQHVLRPYADKAERIRYSALLTGIVGIFLLVGSMVFWITGMPTPTSHQADNNSHPHPDSHQ